MVYRRRIALKTAMLKRMIFYSAILLLTGAPALPGATPGQAARVGVVASWRFDQEERQQHYQHRVWLGLLGQTRMFVTETIDDGVLDDAGRLQQYRAVVIPSTRTVLDSNQFANLRAYVRAGGKLVRDGHAANLPGRLAGELYRVDKNPAARSLPLKFWNDIAGAQADGPIAIDEIKFMDRADVLAELMPRGWWSLKARCIDDNDWMRQATGYRVADAAILAMALPDGASGDAASGGHRPVITLNQHGDGACLSCGINVRAASVHSPLNVYRDFLANIRFWMAE